jgi:hypothetical protein
LTFRRLLLALIAFVALATCALGVVGALLFSAFVALEPRLGGAGAAGLVGLGVAAPLALVAAILSRRLLVPDRSPAGRTGGGLAGFFEDRPALSMGLAIAAGLVTALRPRILSAAVQFFLRPRGVVR